MDLGQTIIARPPQTHAANPLRKGGFNACTCRIALPKCWRLLLPTTGKQSVLGSVGTHVQHATGRLRAGTLCSARARCAGRASKDDLNALWITQGRPASTLLPLWTGGTLSLPVDLEMGSIKAFVRFRAALCCRTRPDPPA